MDIFPKNFFLIWKTKTSRFLQWILTFFFIFSIERYEEQGCEFCLLFVYYIICAFVAQFFFLLLVFVARLFFSVSCYISLYYWNVLILKRLLPLYLQDLIKIQLSRNRSNLSKLLRKYFWKQSFKFQQNNVWRKQF